MPSSSRLLLVLAGSIALAGCGGQIAGRSVDVDGGGRPVHVDSSISPTQPMPVQPTPNQPGPQPVPLPEPVDATIIPTPPSPCPDASNVDQGATCDLAGATCPGILGECQATCTCNGGAWACVDPVCGMPQPSEKCAVNGPCPIENLGSTCTLRGQGPCGSDVKLVCNVVANNAVYSIQSFPCSSNAGSCGFGGAGPNGCSESCMCENGEMVCMGDCPDGGLASP